MRKILLNDICNFEKGSTGLAKAIPGEYPLVATSAYRKSCDSFQFDTKAVCIPLVSSTGHGHASLKNVHYQEGKFALGSILVALTAKDAKVIDIQFLHLYLFQFKDSILVPLMTGAANVSLTVTKVKSIEIPLPSITRQKYIVLQFKRIEIEEKELINELNNQQTLLKKLRQQILQEAIEGKLTKDWREQNPDIEPASELIKRIQAEKKQLIKDKKIKKQKPLTPITEKEKPFALPDGWAWCRLGGICTKVTDGFHNTPTKLKNGNIYISATHIRESGIKWESCLYVGNKDFHELFLKAYPKKGEILITNRGAGCATPVIIDRDVPFSFQNAALIGFNQNLVNNKLIYFYILKMRDEIMETFVNGGLQPMLSNVKLSSIPIPLPPLQEQKTIVTKVEKLLSYCDQLETQINNNQTHAEKLMQAVLKEAFSQ